MSSRPYCGPALVFVLWFALVMAHSCTARSRARCTPNAAALERAVYARAKNHRNKYRRWVAVRLAKAVIGESKRTGLPPLALLSIAEVESHYGYWVKGKAGELGIWQLIRWDVGPTHALKHAPVDILKLRRGRRGHWNSRELVKHIRIATYVAAHEIAMHVKQCRRRRPWGGNTKLFRSSHLKPLGPAPKVLARMAHYNSGTRPPKWAYLRKLGRAYRGLKREACKP